MNNKSFEYISHFGTVFSCESCDFSDPIIIEQLASSPNAIELLLKDMAEMIGWHAVNIRPELNGFTGYDCLTLEFKDDSAL